MSTIVSMVQLAMDYTAAMTGKMDATLMTANASLIANEETTDTPIMGYLTSDLYELNIEVFSSAGSRFIGDIFIFNQPINGTIAGSVYAQDYSSMVQHTLMFLLLSMPTYTAMICHDENLNYLGQMQFADVIAVGYPSIFSNGIWISP
jgi:hypothetical protein